MKRKLVLKIRIAMSLQLIIGLLSFLIGGQMATAAALTFISDTMSTLRASVVANHDIQFTTPTGIGTSQTIVLTFPSGFTVAPFMSFTDLDVATNTVNVNLANTASATNWGVATTSSSITITNNSASAVPAGTVIRIKIGTNASFQSNGVNQITSSTAGQKSIGITGTFTDTGTTTVPIISDDRVTLTATVDQSITFSISASSASFGTLSSSATRYASSTAAGDSVETQAHNLIVGTNAANGYTMTATGTVLTSGINTIDSIGLVNTATSTGIEQFGLRMTASGGVGTVSAPYTGTGFAFATTSMPSQVASATGASSDTTYSVRYAANIRSNTEAGAYSTTLTYIATGNF